MQQIETEHFDTCIATLEYALEKLKERADNVLHGLLSAEECERWLEYRDSRNTTAHDYGEDFAEKICKAFPLMFIQIC
jgi:hypothetical protein